MDGNNRWAKGRDLPATAGHRAGVEAVRRLLRACLDHGVDILTLFAFSSENWSRPPSEVRALLALLHRYLRREVRTLQDDGIRLRFIGNRERFSTRLQRLIAESERATQHNERATLVIAADYGGRWDIAQAAHRLVQDVQSGQLGPEDVTVEALGARVALPDLPAPDLCIRTGGESRISNFMLWQFAYTELYFSDILWPDFDEQAFSAAIADYRRRERRFGGRDTRCQGAPVERAGHA